MANSSETTGTTTTTSSGSGTPTGGSGPKGGPHPKRILELVLLFIILGLVIYNSYALNQQGKQLQTLQAR